MNKTIEQLNWRYATKVFDSNRKLTDEQVNTIKEALRLSISSCGLEMWKFFFIKNPELRKELRIHSWDQSQVTDSAEYIVFAVPKEFSFDLVDKHIKKLSEVRNMDISKFDKYKDMVVGLANWHIANWTIDAWMNSQVYIALGNLATVCAVEWIDSCALEWIDKQKYNEILGLEEKWYRAVVAMAVGYRGDDRYANLPKVRYDLGEVIEEL